MGGLWGFWRLESEILASPGPVGSQVEDVTTLHRVLMCHPWVGADQRRRGCLGGGWSGGGDHLWSVIMSCKTSRRELSLHVSPLHHLTQSHQIIVTPFII